MLQKARYLNLSSTVSSTTQIQHRGHIFADSTVLGRAVDPHSFFADPDPAFFLNADPDQNEYGSMRIRIQLNKFCKK